MQKSSRLNEINNHLKGTDDPEYANLAEVTLWKWNVQKFGHWSVDAKRELTYNGKNFMQKNADGTRSSVNLESWLEKKARERDPEAFADPSWKHKKLWFELILQMEVSQLTCLYNMNNNPTE